MATIKAKVKPVKVGTGKKPGGLYGALAQVPVDHLYELGLSGPVVAKGLWLFLLLLFYIANNHLANKLVFRLNKTKEQVEDLRVDYTTIKHEYMFNSKQSEVAKRMEPYQVVESNVPPRRFRMEQPKD